MPGSDPTPGAGPESPAAERADTGGDRVGAALAAWTRHLVDLGGRNTLLWYRDLPTGTLDLSSAHPAGLATLMAGGPTTLSRLVRDPGCLRGGPPPGAGHRREEP